MISCMNCRKDVPEVDGQVFAGVFVCPICFTLASRLFERSQRELKQLLSMLQEAIRIALVEGKLHFAEGTTLEDVSKKDLLEAIVALNSRREEQKILP